MPVGDYRYDIFSVNLTGFSCSWIVSSVGLLRITAFGCFLGCTLGIRAVFMSMFLPPAAAPKNDWVDLFIDKGEGDVIWEIL